MKQITDFEIKFSSTHNYSLSIVNYQLLIVNYALIVVLPKKRSSLSVRPESSIGNSFRMG